LDETEFCFGNVDGPVSKTLGAEELPFWGYALLFADLIEYLVGVARVIVVWILMKL
jgi:hypothetical protein